ncbi:MAG: preprotein translocase subunit SecG [Hahellaceae bacterium]|nr:preprotein translocase subunit SecG [Hahellaceae bacterium]
MEWLETLVSVAHIFIAVALVGLVLLQQGKGADAGAAFGSGASQTVFGSQGNSSFLSRMTTWLAIVFFVTSFALAVFAKQKADSIAVDQGILPELLSVPAAVEAESSVGTMPDADKVEKNLESGDVGAGKAPELE